MVWSDTRPHFFRVTLFFQIQIMTETILLLRDYVSWHDLLPLPLLSSQEMSFVPLLLLESHKTIPSLTGFPLHWNLSGQEDSHPWTGLWSDPLEYQRHVVVQQPLKLPFCEQWLREPETGWKPWLDRQEIPCPDLQCWSSFDVPSKSRSSRGSRDQRRHPRKSFPGFGRPSKAETHDSDKGMECEADETPALPWASIETGIWIDACQSFCRECP